MCRGVSHTPSMAGNLLSFGEMSYHSLAIYTLFPNIRAYAIRPYTCSFIIVAEYGYSFPLFGDYRGMIGGKYGTKTVILQDDIFY